MTALKITSKPASINDVANDSLMEQTIVESNHDIDTVTSSGLRW